MVALQLQDKKNVKKEGKDSLQKSQEVSKNIIFFSKEEYFSIGGS